MRAELVKNNNDDLIVANTARVSMDKWNKQLDVTPNAKGIPKDIALINYLVEHNHKAPLYHARFTLKLPANIVDFSNISDPMLLMGAVWKTIDNTDMYFRTSIYGWMNLVANKAFGVHTNHVHSSVRHAAYILGLHNTYEALVTKFSIASTQSVPMFPMKDYDSPDMQDVSMRITVPIPAARQLFTHRMFASNEVSRRYVSTAPTFYIPETWRSRPEGSIKQGSGDSVVDESMIHILDDEGNTVESLDYVDIVNLADAWYSNNQHIAPEQARFLLPQAMMTQFIFTGSLTNWARMIVMRIDSHAQQEVQEIARKIEHQLLQRDKNFSKVMKEAHKWWGTTGS